MKRLKLFLLGFVGTAAVLAVLCTYLLGIMWLHDHDYMLASALMALFGVPIVGGMVTVLVAGAVEL